MNLKKLNVISQIENNVFKNQIFFTFTFNITKSKQSTYQPFFQSARLEEFRLEDQQPSSPIPNLS